MPTSMPESLKILLARRSLSICRVDYSSHATSILFSLWRGFCWACGWHFWTRIPYPFAVGRDFHNVGGRWRHTPVAVLCDVLGSDEDNMFATIENHWRRWRDSQWVLRKSCCLRSTTGGMKYAYCSIGFVPGSLEGASALCCGRCCLPRLLVTA